jgi:hypothetical protein
MASVITELELTSATKRVACGANSRNSPSRFAVSSTARMLTPVTLPPGRLRLATRPSATGSEAIAKTIGMLEVAVLAASAPAVLAGAAITATLRWTRSAANSGIRSSRPPAQRNSIATFRPSTYPVSLKPLRNASRRLAPTCAELPPRNPITGIAGCCARAERPRSCCADQCEYEFSPSDVDCHATPPAGGRVHAIEGTISRFSEETNNAFALRKS